MPVARRVLGGNHVFTLRVRWGYAETLYKDPDAALDNLREAVATLEETERIARRVFGGAHPVTTAHEKALRNARAALRGPDLKHRESDRFVALLAALVFAVGSCVMLAI